MIRKDKQITLVSFTHTTGEDDNPKREPQERTVLAGEKSVRSTEFYQAAASDMRPEIVFVPWKREYQGELVVKYQGQEYKVIRTYEPNKEEIELVCSGPGPRPRTR